MSSHSRIRAAIAAVIPGYAPIGRIDESRQEFHVGGRTVHSPRFTTPSGKAKFHVVPQVAPPLGGDGKSRSLRLMTIRSEGQFNTVVYEEEDIYRHQDRRNVILLSRIDMARLGLVADQRVIIQNATGRMRGILVREFDIRPGNAAMYYPEANILVPANADPESRTPAFKSVWVTVEPDNAPLQQTIQILVRPENIAPRTLNAC